MSARHSPLARALAPGLLLVLALAACGEPAASRACAPRPPSDAAASAVEVGGEPPAAPRRIVSTLPGLTELVAALGGTSRLVGVSPHADRPPAVLELPRVGVLPVDVERLVALEPDLVLADPVLQASSLEALASAGAPVLALPTGSVAELRAAVDHLARLLDTPAARAGRDAFNADLEDALAALAALPWRAEDGPPPPRVLIASPGTPLFAVGPGTLLDDLLAHLGAVNVACDLDRASGPFSEELVLARQPDWILLTGARLEAARRARWRDVPAVRREQVAVLPDDLVRAGPRLPAALRRLADVLAGARPPADLAKEDS